MARISGRLRLFGLSLALASLAAVGSAGVVSAYTPPGAVLGTTQGCPTDNPGSSCTVIFHLTDMNGQPVCNATVTFTVTGVTGARVSPTTTTTTCPGGDVQAVFSAGTGCGTATITASSPPASTQTTVNVPCPSGGSLPPTSTTPPSTPGWALGLVALALMVVAGSGLALRRMRLTS